MRQYSCKRIEIITYVPRTVAIRRRKTAIVYAKLHIVPPFCPTDCIDEIQLTLVIGRIIAHVVVSAAVVEVETKHRRSRRVGRIRLEQICVGWNGCASKVRRIHYCRALGVAQVEAEV